eukprot:m.63263 g.63263  ORF g.63263 m.63263 type:complete len:570 (+) comp11571_c0_seq4:153-1862(+)
MLLLLAGTAALIGLTTDENSNSRVAFLVPVNLHEEQNKDLGKAVIDTIAGFIPGIHESRATAKAVDSHIYFGITEEVAKKAQDTHEHMRLRLEELLRPFNFSFVSHVSEGGLVNKLALEAYEHGFGYFVFMVRTLFLPSHPKGLASLKQSLAKLNPPNIGFAELRQVDISGGGSSSEVVMIMVPRTHVDIFGHLFPSDSWRTGLESSDHRGAAWLQETYESRIATVMLETGETKLEASAVNQFHEVAEDVVNARKTLNNADLAKISNAFSIVQTEPRMEFPCNIDKFDVETPGSDHNMGNVWVRQLTETCHEGTWDGDGPCPISLQAWSPNAGCWDSFDNPTQQYATCWKCVAEKKAVQTVMEAKGISAERFLNENSQEKIACIRKTVLVHFRCSDVPFIRHGWYHLYPRSYWRFVAKKIVELGGKYIVFSLCTVAENLGHTNQNEVKCKDFLSAIIKWLREELPQTIVINENPHCWGQRDTFLAMLYSDILVAGADSSFSFVPGVFKGERFISPRYEIDLRLDKRERHHAVTKAVHWNMYDGPPIYHKFVGSYRSFNYYEFDDSILPE